MGIARCNNCEALPRNEEARWARWVKTAAAKRKEKIRWLTCCVTDEYRELVSQMFSLALRRCHKCAQLANGHSDTSGCSQDDQQASVETDRNQRIMGDGVHSSIFVSITPGCDVDGTNRHQKCQRRAKAGFVAPGRGLRDAPKGGGNSD